MASIDIHKVLVTGGCGFIGSNFIRLLRQEHPEISVVNLDALTYAGNLENLAGIDQQENYQFIRGDITKEEDIEKAIDGVDAIVHFAAESHVDRSIMSPKPFIDTNVTGTYMLLEAAKKSNIGRFLHISTDEVYGSAPGTVFFAENANLDPSSPYSASKASADLLVRSYFVTFGFPGIIARSTNNYGPYQFPEKVIPLFLTNALEDKNLPVYGDGQHMRDWIYVEDKCGALLAILMQGEIGEIYNIGAGNSITNLEMTKQILKTVGKPESLIKYVKDRPGHDQRYAVDTTKLQQKTGWKTFVSLEEGLQKTITWYQENQEWWQRIKSGEYLKYYEKLYAGR